jgi:two-component system, chemotaxis family, CheB/CheR fusion protein
MSMFFKSRHAKSLKEKTIASDKGQFPIVITGSSADRQEALGQFLSNEPGNGGIFLAQEVVTAKFNSMPHNAMDFVSSDIVAPLNELPAKFMAFLKRSPVGAAEQDVEMRDKSSLEKIIILLRTHTGNDFSLYKKSTVYRRIQRRMGIHKIDRISAYVNFLQENPKEIVILFKELMIGVTSFFRDTLVWEKLKNTVIPTILANVQPGSTLRAWIPGCSTGEEAYSLAILFKEVLAKTRQHGGISLQIIATDLDNEAVEMARKGLFSVNISAEVSPDRLKSFFIKTDDGYRINHEIRDMVVFTQHNVIRHPPFINIDILSCRNLLIYLDTELQNKMIGLFYHSINSEGFVVLGSAENLGTQGHLFTPVDAKLKIYKRSTTNLLPELFDFPSYFNQTSLDRIERQLSDKSNLNIQALADQLLL